MTTEDQRLLLEVLAHLRAVFYPFIFDRNRRPGGPAAAIDAKRSQYLAGRGISWTIGGTGADRQQGFQILRRLESAGWLKLHRGRTDRRVAVSIARLDEALWLAEESTLRESWHVLRRLAKLRADRESLRNCGFHVIHDCAGISRDAHGPSALATRWVEAATPLAIGGFVESACDTCGLLGWRLTDAGSEALAAGKPKADYPKSLWNADLADEFFERSSELLRRRDEWEGDRNVGSIPLSAGMWMVSAEWAEHRDEQRSQQDAAEKFFHAACAAVEGDDAD